MDYLRDMLSAVSLLRAEEILAAGALLRTARDRGADVYTCGNGGSASTASHLAVDLGRSANRCDGPAMRVVSLTDNVPWLTAVSNDLSYDECFAEPLRAVLRSGDLVIGISASGDSENIVRAFEAARDRGADRLALIGFDGGRLARLATKRVWVDSYDYGIVESLHLFVVHLLVKILAEDHPSTLKTTREVGAFRRDVGSPKGRTRVEIPLPLIEHAPFSRAGHQ